MKKGTTLVDSINKPQYGGTMNLRIESNILTFDPNDSSSRYL